MFPYNEILKVFERKIDWISEIVAKSTTEYQISAKSVKGFGSYEYLKFMPTHRPKYRLCRHNNIAIVTSKFFCYHCVEQIKLHTCTK